MIPDVLTEARHRVREMDETPLAFAGTPVFHVVAANDAVNSTVSLTPGPGMPMPEREDCGPAGQRRHGPRRDDQAALNTASARSCSSVRPQARPRKWTSCPYTAGQEGQEQVRARRLSRRTTLVGSRWISGAGPSTSSTTSNSRCANSRCRSSSRAAKRYWRSIACAGSATISASSSSCVPATHPTGLNSPAPAPVMRSNDAMTRACAVRADSRTRASSRFCSATKMSTEAAPISRMNQLTRSYARPTVVASPTSEGDVR